MCTFSGEGTTRFAAIFIGAFAFVLLDGRQPACVVRAQNPSKNLRWKARSGFPGAAKRPDNEKTAENTLCILKGFEALWAFSCPGKPSPPFSTVGNIFGVSRSGYYDFVHRLGRPEPDAELGQLLWEQQAHVHQTYGYRRMWLESPGIHRNPKTVLRIKKYDTLAEIRRRRKWVQMGQQVHKYENPLNRDFRADKPNMKWVTFLYPHWPRRPLSIHDSGSL